MIWLLFGIFQVSFAANDFELKLQSPKTEFSLKLSDSKFQFQSNIRQIQKKIETCAKPVYQSFVAGLQDQIDSDLTKSPNKKPKRWIAYMNGQTFFVGPLSPSALALEKVEVELDYLFERAALRCPRK